MRAVEHALVFLLPLRRLLLHALRKGGCPGGEAELAALPLVGGKVHPVQGSVKPASRKRRREQQPCASRQQPPRNGTERRPSAAA